MKALVIFTALLLPSFSGQAQVGDALKRLGGRAPSSDNGQTASGLKEALEIGSKNTVAQTRVTDGFFRNEAIRIGVPAKLQMVDKGLRMAGQGPLIDEFVLSMNLAAEKAAPAAQGIFTDAITK